MKKNIVRLLLSCWSIGLGLRLIQYPIFNEFDRIFDFSILFILGLINAIITIYDIYKEMVRKNEKNRNLSNNTNVC